MSIAQILLVDDDPALLDALSGTIALHLCNIEVHTASSAPEALRQMQQQDYGAIVSDIKMPGMDGFDLLACVSKEYPEVPVVLITGHGEHALAIRALREGAYDYIQKPIDRDDFVVALSRALQTSRLRREVSEQQQALEQHAFGLERLVEYRFREPHASNAFNERVLRTVLDDLSTPLTQLQRVSQQLENSLLNPAGEELLDQSLTEMKRSLQKLEELASYVQEAITPDQ